MEEKQTTGNKVQLSFTITTSLDMTDIGGNVITKMKGLEMCYCGKNTVKWQAGERLQESFKKACTVEVGRKSSGRR